MLLGPDHEPQPCSPAFVSTTAEIQVATVDFGGPCVFSILASPAPDLPPAQKQAAPCSGREPE